MKKSTWKKWFGKRVRSKTDPKLGLGTVVEAGKGNTWWTVQWDNGKRSRYPERMLEVVEQ